MEYTKPTYEQYCKASKFAKLRYRCGVYIQIIAAILLLFLVFYTVTNVEEMKAHPAEYAEEKLGVICYSPYQTQTEYYGIIGNITNVEKEW